MMQGEKKEGKEISQITEMSWNKDQVSISSTTGPDVVRSWLLRAIAYASYVFFSFPLLAIKQAQDNSQGAETRENAVKRWCKTCQDRGSWTLSHLQGPTLNAGEKEADETEGGFGGRAADAWQRVMKERDGISGDVQARKLTSSYD